MSFLDLGFILLKDEQKSEYKCNPDITPVYIRHLGMGHSQVIGMKGLQYVMATIYNDDISPYQALGKDGTQYYTLDVLYESVSKEGYYKP